METLQSGIKVCHKDPEGILRSTIQCPWYRNRVVEYMLGEETFPNEGCGPLAIYEDTEFGLVEAMADARIWTKGCCAVFRCTFKPSEETELYYTFDGGEPEDKYRHMHYSSFVAYPSNLTVGEVVRRKDFPPHTVLADMIRLDEEIATE